MCCYDLLKRCVRGNPRRRTSRTIQAQLIRRQIKSNWTFLSRDAGSRSWGEARRGGPGRGGKKINKKSAIIWAESNRLISLRSSLYLPLRWMWVKTAAQIVTAQTISMEHNRGGGSDCRDLHSDARQGTHTLSEHTQQADAHSHTICPLHCNE